MSFFKGLMKRPVTVLMVTIMMLVFGGISTINMEQSLLPDISMPNIIVMTTYSGAGPEEVEKLVTEPIEQAVSTVPNFVNVTSTSSYGSSMVMVEVSSEADMNFTALKVREQISMIDA
ncbi:MAG: efflux RND transporter permease subunit, partial [Clostridia bacterium]|nr:efflux RND transporter permease subunit [Clostridia bacterium]